MLSAYKITLSSALEGIYTWIVAVVPFLHRSASADLIAGVLPSDVCCAPLDPPTPEPVSPIEQQFGSDNPPRRDRRPGAEQVKQKIRMRSQKWYCAMIIWYILLELPKEYLTRDMRDRLWSVIEPLTSNQFKNEDNRTDTAILDDAYGCILRWYHSFSVWKLYRTLETEDPVRFGKLHIEVKEAEHKQLSDHWQEKAEKALRLFGQGRYLRQTLGHEVAYLAVVGAELGVDQGPRIQLGVNLTCLEHVTKLIDRRQGTSTLYPGAARVSRWDNHDVRSAVKRPAPWELSCLGHHVPLCFDLRENQEEVMQNCWQFLLSDGLFLASIDPCSVNAVSQWWDLTASAIVCTKLLEEIEFALRKRESWISPDSLGTEGFQGATQASYVRCDSPTPSLRSTAPHRKVPSKGVRFDESAKADDFRSGDFKKSEFGRPGRKSPLYAEAIQGKEMQRFAEVFAWERRLPLGLFHPDTSLLSLGNTPDLFDVKQTKSVFLRPQIAKNYEKQWRTSGVPWTLENIFNILRAAALRHISCVDLSLSIDSNGGPDIVIAQKQGRVQCVDGEFWSSLPLTPFETLDTRSARKVIKALKANPGLLDLYFVGRQERHPKFSSLEHDVQVALRHPRLRQKFLETYQSSLLNTLNDNLVDLGIKYRLIFMRQLTSETARGMVYVWHPDALDTLDSHLGSLSQFSDVPGQQAPRGGEELWVSSISLIHWRLESQSETEVQAIENKRDTLLAPGLASKTTGEGQTLVGRIWGWLLALASSMDKQESVDDGKAVTGKPGAVVEFPPATVIDPRKANESSEKHVSKIRELSVSLVMTGDWGRYWTCTVMSELIDETTAWKYAQEVREIMQMFVHQHYTGRVLVFLLLLSYLCEGLAVECENFQDELEKIMEMDAIILLRGMAWSKSDVALKKLKRMLWGLEALRIFSDKLARAINEVTRARDKMATWLMVGYNLRHSDMEREKQRVVEEFDKRRDRLRNAHASIQQRIEQGSRLREGISSVIGVEQNENISMLTWVTIAYLPLAFVAGVFSMDHLILPLDAGWPMYGWLTAAFLVCTVMFALTLQYWITTFRHVGAAIHRFPEKASLRLHSFKKGGKMLSTSAVTGWSVAGRFGMRRRGVGRSANDEEAGSGGR